MGIRYFEASTPDSAWDRINRGDYDELKVIDVHMPSGRAIKTLIPIKHFSVAPPVIKLQTPGQEPEPKPDKCSGLEYVEGPPPTWVTSLKVPKNPNFGDKPLKTFAGRDLSEAH